MLLLGLVVGERAGRGAERWLMGGWKEVQRLARMTCGASLADGHAADASRMSLSLVLVTPDFEARNSACFLDSSRSGSLGLIPEIRDTYASNRRLAGTRSKVDFHGGGKSA